MTGRIDKPVQKPTEAAHAPRPAPEPKGEHARAPKEIGGPAEPEPTRYGDWERNGRCTDF